MGVDGHEVADSDRVEIVVVPRERYSPTVRSVSRILATTPRHVRLTMVAGGMPSRTVARVAALDAERVRVVGPRRHLAPNAARRIGFRETTARYVVFMDNDVEPATGWLEPLVAVAEEHGAGAVRPLVLQRVEGQVTVHESGGDCHVLVENGQARLVEAHRHSRRAPSEVESLRTERVELLEFHTVLFDRAVLAALGGPDEAMRSQGDHLDLALRLPQVGGSIWLAAESQVVYQVPDGLGPRDLSFFLGRWSRSWNVASRSAFCAKFGLDPTRDDSYTWRYPEVHRAYAWRPLGRVVSRVVRRDVAQGVAVRFDRWVGRHVAEVVLRASPKWRGDGMEDVG